jgi:hypothetical protein
MVTSGFARKDAWFFIAATDADTRRVQSRTGAPEIKRLRIPRQTELHFFRGPARGRNRAGPLTPPPPVWRRRQSHSSPVQMTLLMLLRSFGSTTGAGPFAMRLRRPRMALLMEDHVPSYGSSTARFSSFFVFLLACPQ